MTPEQAKVLRKNATVAKIAVEIVQALAACDYSLTALDLGEIVHANRRAILDVLEALAAARKVEPEYTGSRRLRFRLARPQPQPQAAQPQPTP
jgi:hypothetical protein